MITVIPMVGVHIAEPTNRRGLSEMANKVCITGKAGITKNDLKRIIQPELEVARAVIKSMRYLVLVEDPGEKGMQDPRNCDIEIISWEDFIEFAHLENELADARHRPKKELEEGRRPQK
ncbi:MAG: hypothetical protein R6V83_02680 [Candidatus Thorarchaeota archaeon]